MSVYENENKRVLIMIKISLSLSQTFCPLKKEEERKGEDECVFVSVSALIKTVKRDLFNLAVKNFGESSSFSFFVLEDLNLNQVRTRLSPFSVHQKKERRRERGGVKLKQWRCFYVCSCLWLFSLPRTRVKYGLKCEKWTSGETRLLLLLDGRSLLLLLWNVG